MPRALIRGNAATIRQPTYCRAATSRPRTIGTRPMPQGWTRGNTATISQTMYGVVLSGRGTGTRPTRRAATHWTTATVSRTAYGVVLTSRPGTTNAPLMHLASTRWTTVIV